MFKNVVHDLLGAATDHISGRIGRPEEASYPARKEEDRSPVTEYKAAPLPLTNSSFSPPCGTLQSSQFTFARKASKDNPVTKFKNIFLGKGPNIALYEEGLRDYAPFSGPRNANQTEFGRKWRSPEYLLRERSQSDDDPMKIRRTQGDGCDQICDFKEVNHDDEEDLITGDLIAIFTPCNLKTSSIKMYSFFILILLITNLINPDIINLINRECCRWNLLPCSFDLGCACRYQQHALFVPWSLC